MAFAFRSSSLLAQRCCSQSAARLVAGPLQRSIASSVAARVSPKEAEVVERRGEFGANEIVFNPLKEGKAELEQVEKAKLNSPAPEESYARHNFAFECEAAINQQINHEYTFSYSYHQMASYFNRDNVALPGFAAFFRASSLEERTHAQLLMDYQARRGGRVKLAAIMAPDSDALDIPGEKGDALHVLQLALALEKLNHSMLSDLHEVADRQGDAQMADFVEEMLDEQTHGIKVIADFTAQLQRIGKGLAVLEFDRTVMAPAAEKMLAEVLPAL